MSNILPSVSDVATSAKVQAVETYNYLNNGEIKHGTDFSVLRHTRPFVIYQGVKTIVPISVFGNRPVPKKRRVYLQRRGYRTGLLGWAIGGWLGGSKLPGLDVTPEDTQDWDTPTGAALSTKQRAVYDKDISHLFVGSFAPRENESESVPLVATPKNQEDQKLLATVLVHIPVASGDGYFRLRLTDEKNIRKSIAESPVFRVGSLTWSSAHPQGASPLGLIPELGARAGFLAVRTAAWGAFYAAFPFLKVAEMMPGAWGQRAMKYTYSLVGGAEKKEELDRKMGISKGLSKANDRMYKDIPFGAVGVRTAADLVVDQERGRGGIWYDRSAI